METTAAPKTHYQRQIAKMKAAQGFDPRHIEAFMRLQYSTLDHLDKRTFNREVRIGVECIKEGGVDAAERNARSFGL